MTDAGKPQEPNASELWLNMSFSVPLVVPKGETPHNFKQQVAEQMVRILGLGALGAVDVKSLLLDAPARALDEEALEQWFQGQIEDGHLDAEGMAGRLARIALAGEAANRQEFAERMAVGEGEEGDEDDSSSIVLEVRDVSSGEVLIQLDAVPWLLSCPDDEIYAVAEERFRGPMVSERMLAAVASNVDLSRQIPHDLLAKINQSEGQFEGEILRDSFYGFLGHSLDQAWDADILARCLCAEAGVKLVEAQEDEVAGRFDWFFEGDASDVSFETAGEAAKDATMRLGLTPDNVAEVVSNTVDAPMLDAPRPG